MKIITQALVTVLLTSCMKPTLMEQRYCDSTRSLQISNCKICHRTMADEEIRYALEYPFDD